MPWVTTGQAWILYLVGDTSFEDDTPRLYEILVKQGGEKRIRVGTLNAVLGTHRTEYVVKPDGTLVPPILSRTPEEAFARYIALRERAIELAHGTIKRCERQLAKVRVLYMKHATTTTD